MKEVLPIHLFKILHNLEFNTIVQCNVEACLFVKVNLLHKFIPHKTFDGRFSKTGYVKFLAFSQVLEVSI